VRAMAEALGRTAGSRYSCLDLHPMIGATSREGPQFWFLAT
jgi:hypothetical protein